MASETSEILADEPKIRPTENQRATNIQPQTIQLLHTNVNFVKKNLVGTRSASV